MYQQKATMKFRISVESSFDSSDWPKQGQVTVFHDGTITTGITADEQMLVYMINNHLGVADAILDYAKSSNAALIRLYLDHSTHNGVRATVEPMSEKYYQFGQIELFPPSMSTLPC